MKELEKHIRETDQDFCRVRVLDGKQFLAMPDGTLIPKVKNTIVVQPIDLALKENPYVWVRLTVLAKLDETK